MTHTRTIHVVNEERVFVIEDELEGDGVHDFEFNLQLAPNRNAEVTAAENGMVRCRLDDPQVQLTVAGTGRSSGFNPAIADQHNLRRHGSSSEGVLLGKS